MTARSTYNRYLPAHRADPNNHPLARASGIRFSPCTPEERSQLEQRLRALQRLRLVQRLFVLASILAAWGPGWWTSARDSALDAWDGARNALYLHTHRQPPAPPVRRKLSARNVS